MSGYDIKITATKDPISAISAGITVCKALNLEWVSVLFSEGFTINVRQDSNITDSHSIYNLTAENNRLRVNVIKLEKLLSETKR